MRYPVLSLLLLPVSTPALAHVEAAPHTHVHDSTTWAVALVSVAFIAFALFRKGH